jgi:hypothetical protein
MTAARLLSTGFVVGLLGTASVGAVPQVPRAAVPPPPVVPLAPLTRLEALLTQPDAVVSEDRVRMNERQPIAGVVMDAVIVTELTPRQEVLRGLRVEVRDGADHAAVSYVDADEVTALSGAIARIWDLAAQWTGREEARSSVVQFTSLGGFAVGFRQDGRDQHAFVVSGLEAPVRVPITVAEFSTLKQGVDQALQLFAR